MRRRTSGPARGLIFLLTLAVIGGLFYANYQFALRSPGGNDFLSRWMGAKSWLLDGISPYDPQVSLRSQEVIYGRPARPDEGEDVAHFVYPLPSMVFFGPFGLLPYTLARAIWMTLLEIGLPLLIYLALRIARWNPTRGILTLLFLFSITWYHGFRAIILGQFAVFEAVLMAGALLAIQREQDGLAGLLLALSLSKPQMSFLLIPFVVLWGISSRRWALILSTVGISVLLIGLSVVLLPDWPLRWIQQVLSYPDYTSTQPPVGIIADVFPAISSWINIGLTLLFILYLLWEWYLALRKGDSWFQWTASMTILVTNLIVVRTATTNYLAMVPGLILIFSVWVERWRGGGRWAVAIVLLIFLLGPWSLFLLTVDGNIEDPVMYLPFPIFMLAGLWWVRWWCTRTPKLPLEGILLSNE